MSKLTFVVLLVALAATLCAPALANAVTPIVPCECWERCQTLESNAAQSCHCPGKRLQCRRLQLDPAAPALAPVGGTANETTTAPVAPGTPNATLPPVPALAPAAAPLNITSPNATAPATAPPDLPSANATAPVAAPVTPVAAPMALDTPTMRPTHLDDILDPPVTAAPHKSPHSNRAPVVAPKTPEPESSGISGGGIFGVVVALFFVFGLGYYLVFGRRDSSNGRHRPDGMRQMEVGRYNSRDDDNGLL